MAALIGIDATRSHVSRTSRDSPLPSEPTTSTSGPAAISSASTGRSPSASRPTTNSPACWKATSARVRLVARATGIRAAAPAEVFQAEAVIPAERRSGTTTPCPPKAATERTIAPTLRGSVTPSRATISGS